MAVKKAVKKRVSVAAEVGCMTIPAETLLAGLKRFGTVCEYVEREMYRRPLQRDDAPQEALQPSLAPPQAPQSAVGVEQMAYEVRSLAQDVQKQAEAIRLHLTTGGNNTVEGANAAASPTRGPIKDCIEGTGNLLFSIRRDLDTIAQYVSGQ